ncbi:MAG: hypothetical protein A2Z20_06480 [Bdellovibrionales bacterium RBG_16_40_8]|nr:MAG: hypothetical protein A2Z20_06480 [Bdellovibrionales bacterium RBG_16_40_8]
MDQLSEFKSRLYNYQSILKFCYVGDAGAAAWNKMRGDKSFQVGSREISVLERLLIVAMDLSKNSPINVLHIGPGNGIEVPHILKYLNATRGDQYNAIDISESMLSDLKLKMNDSFNACNIKYSTHLLDVERDVDLIKFAANCPTNYKNVYIATGEGTLLASGVVPVNLRKVMRPGDLALFNLDSIGTDSEKICAEYDQSSFREFITGSLRYAKNIGLIKDLAGKFHPTEYDHKTSRVSCRYYLEEIKSDVLLLETLKPNSLEKAEMFFKQLGHQVAYATQYDNAAFGIVCK